MIQKPLNRGDVVQLGPGVLNPIYYLCLMVITETKSWGAIGTIILPEGRMLYYRAVWNEMEYVGQSKFKVPDIFSKD